MRFFDEPGNRFFAGLVSVLLVLAVLLSGMLFVAYQNNWGGQMDLGFEIYNQEPVTYGDVIFSVIFVYQIEQVGYMGSESPIIFRPEMLVEFLDPATLRIETAITAEAERPEVFILDVSDPE